MFFVGLMCFPMAVSHLRVCCLNAFVSSSLLMFDVVSVCVCFGYGFWLCLMVIAKLMCCVSMCGSR